MDQLALGNLDDIRDNQDNEPSAKSDPVKLNHSPSQSILDGTSPRLAEIQLGTRGATFGQPSATTATDTTEVYGQMDRPYSPQFMQSRQNKPTITPKSTTYDSDPYISKMVKAAYVNLPTTEPVDFGSQIVPVNFAEHLHNPTSSSRKSNWKPTGVLASQFTEHKDAVNKIAISPDHNFFLTCSDDGRVDPTKVYQIIKFEESTYKKTQQQRKNKRSKREADEPAISEKEPELLCVAVGIDSPREGEGLQHVHVLTGGTDRKIRFWDLQSMEASSIVSGLATDTDAASVGLFKTYNNGVKVIGERTTTAAAASSSRAKPVAANGVRGAAPSVRYSRSSRTAIIASEQQDMARNHQASIVDIAILHKPYQMIISADRAGVIKVFI
ncbi:hypothetical protein DV451_001414 [Geotrichum candidum]|uniref:Uncharacterized protein n=1 Tax=Geotrichum candidum TaxID=1173061 RepID=A0A9P5G897_GEOCN|nr:hypothetical protein DV451_001414 [Geotrichum candidum]